MSNGTTTQPQLPVQQQAMPNDGLSIMELIQMQKQLDKMMVLQELMKVFDIEVVLAGDKQTILNQEMITEYSNAKTTQFMVRNETWRKSVQQVFHMKDINDEKLVGYMDAQVILKMKSHRRKGSQEIVNALRNDVAGTEVIPSKQKTKKFLGII